MAVRDCEVQNVEIPSDISDLHTVGNAGVDGVNHFAHLLIIRHEMFSKLHFDFRLMLFLQRRKK